MEEPRWLRRAEVVAPEDEARRVIEEAAAGDLSEEDLVEWLDEVVEPVEPEG